MADDEYRKSCERAVDDIIRYGAEHYPHLYAADAMGVMFVAGTRIGQRAGLDHHAAGTLRAIADELDAAVN